ncbi:uncharacterized protein LOC124137574 isoform X2 [Haliotis rufescens]|uniref:uncharacterized protein LOC124137574 isoform X2 n=1 Tax=Haliotis rufescens TaxID=6454 RepID=UPI00201EBC70|nr:uncharacterized protein LOC124137574 isoform X2 [Haliotis rufescens]
MITQQIGNYFIMDSEQLVSNPYQEMQSEAIGDYGKKSSLTEKFTSVKNNVCENHFNMARSQLEREKDSRLRHLQENTSRLRYEVKLLDLNRRKNEIEMRKRIEPRRDFTYDDTQLTKTERRLGANIESHYLDRKLRYPVRAKAVSDIAITPAVARARSTLRQQKMRPDSERAVTAKSICSSMTVDSSHVREGRSRHKWPASRSAPLTSSSYGSRDRSHDSHSRFPTIRQTFEGNSSHDKQRGSSQHVKFAFESPHKLIVSSETGSSVHPGEHMYRSYTYYGGMNRRPTFYHDSSSEEESDDDFDSSEKIDLRAILFGKSQNEDTMSVKSRPHSELTCTSQGFGVRRSQGAPQQLTQEKLQKETKVIQNKINIFLRRLETDPPIKKKVFYDSESEDELTETGNTIPFVVKKKKPPPPPQAPPPKKKEEEVISEEDSSDSAEMEGSEVPEKRSTKDAWKYIRGHMDDGMLQGTYTAADLVLQQLTGVLVGHSKKPTVPLNCASRAMRHTATFKMRKVVEGLIESRTKYEQHEVDELKKKMDGDGDVEVPPASEASYTDIPQQVV